MTSYAVKDLAALVGGAVEGDGAKQITGLSGLEEAKAGQLSFYGNPRYKQQYLATQATAVLVDETAPKKDSVTLIRVKQPHLAFAKVAQTFFPPKRHPPGVSPRAFVHPEAKVHSTAAVMAFASVEKGAVVGENTVLHPSAYVGEGATIGKDTVLYPGATVLDGCKVGERCILHSNSVVGADGFGFAFDPEKVKHEKIPQAGIARLEDDVELGACACVDRATLGETVVGQGSKIDNLVQVAHNVTIGPHSILCAQAGVSGSAKVGAGVILAGQVGIAGHISVGNLAKIGAQAGVAQDVDDGATLLGAPAIAHTQYLRSAMVFEKLPELAKELRALKKRIDTLENELSQVRGRASA
ncbi:MAG: UDP-3-O-(3-hydroxymyristoyl)glucosamine N-acyltransferase [Myxococcaceae bacterium]